MNRRDFANVDPHVCHGQACVRETRIPVSVVLDNLAAGDSINDLLASYPSRTTDSVRAGVSYAAEVTRERFVALPA